ncbi:DNA topoisomerase [Yersinia intermedia]|uniref:DNA topoisomerase n=1 Tax=Yersinia intermedia TaxID=631 RepID=UPI0039C6B800
MVIETLLARGFIVKKGKSLHAAVVAGELMGVLPMPLKDLGMTALWEQALDDIAEGKSPWMTLWQSSQPGPRSWSRKGFSRR